jgi:PilZ domain
MPPNNNLIAPIRGIRGAERRTASRRRSDARVWADPGGVLPVVDCKILDLSKTGAQLLVLQEAELPQRFLLQHDSSRILGMVEVVWRKEHRVGVRFCTRNKASP